MFISLQIYCIMYGMETAITLTDTLAVPFSCLFITVLLVFLVIRPLMEHLTVSWEANEEMKTDLHAVERKGVSEEDLVQVRTQTLSTSLPDRPKQSTKDPVKEWLNEQE